MQSGHEDQQSLANLLEQLGKLIGGLAVGVGLVYAWFRKQVGMAEKKAHAVAAGQESPSRWSELGQIRIDMQRHHDEQVRLAHAHDERAQEMAIKVTEMDGTVQRLVSDVRDVRDEQKIIFHRQSKIIAKLGLPE